MQPKRHTGKHAEARTRQVIISLASDCLKKGKNILCVSMVSKSTFTLIFQLICRAQLWQNGGQLVKIENHLKQ